MNRRRNTRRIRQSNVMIEEEEQQVEQPYHALLDNDFQDRNELQAVHDEENPDLLLRNDDDRSQSSSSSSSSSLSSLDWSPSEIMELRFSCASNLLFILGAAIQTSLAVWDIKSLYNSEDEDNDAVNGDAVNSDAVNGDAANGDEYQWTKYDYLYSYLTLAGSGCYVVNAVVDVIWAKKIGEGEENNADSLGRGGMPAAIFFFLGSATEFLCCFLWRDSTGPTPVWTYLSMASVHIYFISGVLALKQQRMQCSWWSRSMTWPQVLAEVGQAVFLFGCTIDVVLSYISNPTVIDTSASTKAYGNLVSTLTWFISAVLYIASDCLEYSIFQNSHWRVLIPYCERSGGGGSSSSSSSSSSTAPIPLLIEQRDRVE